MIDNLNKDFIKCACIFTITFTIFIIIDSLYIKTKPKKNTHVKKSYGPYTELFTLYELPDKLKYYQIHFLIINFNYLFFYKIIDNFHIYLKLFHLFVEHIYL